MNEIKINFSLQAALNGVSVSKTPASLSLTWTGGTYTAQTASIGTTWQALPAAAGLGTSGMMYVYNAGTETVSLSFDSGITAHLSAKAGEYQFFRLASTVAPESIQAKSDGTGAVLIDYAILSD